MKITIFEKTIDGKREAVVEYTIEIEEYSHRAIFYTWVDAVDSIEKSRALALASVQTLLKRPLSNHLD